MFSSLALQSRRRDLDNVCTRTLTKQATKSDDFEESMLEVAVTHIVQLLKIHQVNSRCPDDVGCSSRLQVFEYDLVIFLL